VTWGRMSILAVLAIGLGGWGCAQPSGGGQSDEDAVEGENADADPRYNCGGPPPATYGIEEAARDRFEPGTRLPRIVREAERPAQVDLSDHVPTPCQQGHLSSCTGWATGYGLMTFLAAWNIDGWVDLDRTDRQFSPAFIFNQANVFRLERGDYTSCVQAGARMRDVFDLLRNTGCVTWMVMPYIEGDCSSQPEADALQQAGDFMIEYSCRIDEPDVVTVQSYLSQDIPLVVLLNVGESFGDLGPDEVYDTVEQGGPLRHAVLAVGYDDAIGAVKIMNSWGNEWGDGGFGFASYGVWDEIAHSAYRAGNQIVTTVEAVGADGARLRRPAAQEIPPTGGCAFNPLLDSDGDGYEDTVELEFAAFGFDPQVPDPNPDFEEKQDADGDGWPDYSEVAFGSDPRDFDDFPFDCDYEYPAGYFDEPPEAVGCTDFFLFEVRSFPAGGTGGLGVAVAQLDDDALPDVVIANNDLEGTETGASVVLLRGGGDGSLAAPETLAAGGAPRYLTAADLTGDGANDLVFTDQDAETANVLLGAGDGGFAAGAALAIDDDSGPVVLVDLNGDLALDLIAPRSTDTLLFFGDGGGTFPTQEVVDVGLSQTPVIAADFNNDGLPDLAGFTQLETNFGVAILTGAGDGTFTPSEAVEIGRFGVTISVPIALGTGDFNQDNNADLVVGLVSDDQVILLYGAGDGTLGEQVEVPVEAVLLQPDGLAVADVDTDGQADLLLASRTGDVVVLRNNGDGTFTESRQQASGAITQMVATLATGDLDGDGDVDIVVPGAGLANVATVRNVCPRR